MIKGSKLIILSGKTRQFWAKKQWGDFFGGMVLIITSLFVLYASTIYNNAIATTDTDLIANAVIILFVADLDEMMLSILVVLYPDLFPTDGFPEVIKEKVETLESEMQEVQADNSEMKEKVNTFESKYLKMKERLERSEADHSETKKRVKTLESGLQQSEADHLETKECVEHVKSQLSDLLRKA